VPLLLKDEKVEIVLSVLRKLSEKETLYLEEFRSIVGDTELYNLLATKGRKDPANRKITFDLQSKLEISLIALKYGAEIESVCKILSWREFEAFSREVLERNNYSCMQNFRFKLHRKRYEIDVIGLKRPLIVCVDAKHYRKSGKTHTLRVACKKQVERTEALSETLPETASKLRITSWEKVKIVPLIVTLLPEEVGFFERVPVVPFFKLNSFLIELQTHISEIFHIQTKLPKYTLLRYENP